MRELPDAVLFDMDGTLIDSEGLWLEAETMVMAGLGSTWSSQDQAHSLGASLETVADYMIQKSGTTVAADVIGHRLLDAMESRLRNSPLSWRPGARSLVVECRDLGVPTALVSASWNRLIEAVGEKIDADIGCRAFDIIVAGDDVENGKPHPDPYLTAARELGMEPDRCLALEDSPTGVRSAVAAGCRVVAIPHVAEVVDTSALVIDSLESWSLARLWQES